MPQFGRWAAWLAAALILAAGAIYFATFGGGGRTTRDAVGPTTFSRSAIGHAGIADMLRRLDIGVTKSVSNSASKVRSDGVLVIAEPDASVPAQQLRLLLTARTVLIVLPKRVGRRSRKQPAWIEWTAPMPESAVTAALDVLGVKAEAVRVQSVGGWLHNEVGTAPAIDAPVQLVKSPRLRAVISSGDGMLVGEVRTNAGRLFVLADPDVLENHGIAQPANAAFAVALVNFMRGRNGNVVFDETVHGYGQGTAAPWAVLFEFPFVLVTLQGAIAVALLLWATMGRFGAPLPPVAALTSGKQGLIENTATLFEFAGYQAAIVQRYVHAIMRDAARQLHAPTGLSDAEVAAWLDRVGAAHKVDVTCAALLARAQDLHRRGGRGHGDPALLASLAGDTYRWKREIIDGRPGHSGDGGRHPRRSSQGGGRPG
jgi:uncharacterized protein DUF4350